MRLPKTLAALVLCAATLHVSAQQPAPARDMTLELDASDAPRHILHARIVIPAQPGPLKLYYPKWIPGEHGPSGPVTDLVGLEVNAGGNAIPWRRDDLDMYTIHCQVPQGASEVEVKLDYLDSQGGNFSGGKATTAKLAVVSWNHVLLYPEGKPVSQINCRASIRLPPGWKLGTALMIDPQQGQAPDAPVLFQPVSLETLVDSPVLCGLHFRDVNIGPKGVVSQHTISIAADTEQALRLPPELKANYDRLVSEGSAMFGGRRYQSYRFLLCLSDQVEHFGLEHHASSDNRAPERTLTNDKMRKTGLGALLPHEFVHAWNGKYRRPADMITPTFQEPQRTRLLWVYEGLTQYLGIVLTARSGVWTPERTREVLAAVSAGAQDRRGRAWRPLDDTAAAAQLLFHAPEGWENLRRGVDFYNEGALVWLEADTIIRHNTRGKRSLDDFCRRFFAGGKAEPLVKPYTLDELIADLDAVAPYDWRTFFANRMSAVAPEPPLSGIRNGGWKLGFGEEPTEYARTLDEDFESVNELASIGLIAQEKDGQVIDVVPDKPAHRAGVSPGMKIVAVNGRKFSPDVLRDAVAATKDGDGKVELLCENADFVRGHTLEYKGGRKYPRLERDETRPDLLTAILSPAAGDGK